MGIKVKKGTAFDRSKAVYNLVNRDKLTPHLERAANDEFEWEYKYTAKEKDDAWHPSGHCTPDVRVLYDIARQLAVMVDEEDNGISVTTPPSSANRIFQVGHFWHQYLQEMVRRLEFADERAIEREGKRFWGEDPDAKVRPFEWARGSGDVAPCVIPKHGEFVVDFKTMGGFDFRKSGLPEWAAAKYEAQINIYMDFFDIERGLIVGVQKDTPHGFKEYEFRRNQKLIDTIYDKWQYVSELLYADKVTDADLNHKFDLPLTGPFTS